MTITRTRAVAIALASAVALLVTLIAPAPADAGAQRTYRVTIENLTDGQPMTPFVVATHSGATAIFNTGSAASAGLQDLAENGGVPTLIGELGGNSRVGDVTPAFEDPNNPGPIAPGGSATTYITSNPGARKLSVAAMLICTNDGFAAINSVQLNANGKAQVVYGNSYDAGTEINTENYEDLVLPCDGLGSQNGTDPALAENGVVHRHQFLSGNGDLALADHQWTDPAIKVTIELVD